MAQPNLKVNTQLDPSGIQKGIDKSNKEIQNFANKTEGALRDLGSEALGATGPFKRIADAMLGMGPSGTAVTAVTVGIGAVIKILDVLRERQIAAAERQNILNEAFRGVSVAEITAAQGASIGAIAQIEKTRRDLTAEQVVLQQKLQPAFRQQAYIQSQINDLQEKYKKGQVSESFYRDETAALLKRKEAVKSQAGFAEDFAKFEQNRAQLILLGNQQQLATVRSLVEQKQLYESILKTTGTLSQQQRQALEDTIKQLSQIATGTGTPEVRLAAMSALPAAETDAERTKRLEEERLKVIRETKAQFDTLFSLTAQGYALSDAQQAQLMETTKHYASVVADTTKSIEERTIAAQALATIEKDSENRRNETERILAEKERERQKVFNDAIKEEEKRINNYALGVNALTEGFELMFSVIGQGGNAFANLGRGFIQMTRGLAKSKASENIAYAIENFAKAIGFTATGQLLQAANAKASALTHLKAAAAWGALAGAASAGGATAAGGGAGGGGGFSQSALGREDFGGTRTIFLTITGGGILDMNDPKTQRDFVRALEAVSRNRTVLRFAP